MKRWLALFVLVALASTIGCRSATSPAPGALDMLARDATGTPSDIASADLETGSPKCPSKLPGEGEPCLVGNRRCDYSDDMGTSWCYCNGPGWTCDPSTCPPGFDRYGEQLPGGCSEVGATCSYSWMSLFAGCECNSARDGGMEWHCCSQMFPNNGVTCNNQTIFDGGPCCGPATCPGPNGSSCTCGGTLHDRWQCK